MAEAGEYLNEPLSRHTTFKIGGPAERLIIPPDRRSLLETISGCIRTKTSFFLLGRGSNTLVKDRGVKGVVIKNTESCSELDYDGKYMKVGSSLPLQKLVRFCHENDLFGMEYLYSVPGNVGGAVCMNAGTGEYCNPVQAISDHLVSIEVFDGAAIKTIRKEECAFTYRTSIFHKMKGWIILSATFELPHQDREIGAQRIKERLALVEEFHDLGYANAGTIFKRNFQALPEIIGHQIGKAKFSEKTPGWIINLGGASCHDVVSLIRYAQRCHKKRRARVPELEIIIATMSWWDRNILKL